MNFIMKYSNITKVLLIILDGFGISKNTKYNAIEKADKPFYNYLCKNYAFGTVKASGSFVGLPKGQFGNSEVGHLNIGAGRIVKQDITIIDDSILNNKFCDNPNLLSVFNRINNNNLHLIGLLSDGGVHSHINHIVALINCAIKHNKINHIFLHIILDGRDTPPQSALIYINQIMKLILQYDKIKIATISGRYYAMDRDQRFDRIKLAYDAIINGDSKNRTDDIIDFINNSYAKGINDEFIIPIVCNNYNGISENDGIIFANFRSDRAIQLTKAIMDPDFSHFKRSMVTISVFATMTLYSNNLNVTVLFQKENVISTLGEYLSNIGLKQLRIAETEKYPHVTYFFNGGVKKEFPNEDRILVPSNRNVRTYDEIPEMSLPEISKILVEKIKENKYDFIVANFANADMVGHTGNFEASIKAIEAIDQSLMKVVTAMQEQNGEVVITADHGNCEEMYDSKNNQPHTQHTSNYVPFIYIGRAATIMYDGALQDIAPSILSIMNLNKPKEMTGTSLIHFN